MPIYLCPSDPSTLKNTTTSGTWYNGRSNYFANTGSRADASNPAADHAGPFVTGFTPPVDAPPLVTPPPYAESTKVTLIGIADGTSNTALFSETKRTLSEATGEDTTNPLIGRSVAGTMDLDAPTNAECSQATFSGGSRYRYIGLQYWRGGIGWTAFYNHTMTPNSPIRGACYASDVVPSGKLSQLTVGHLAARSYHGGGVNVVACDGSVRYVTDGVALGVWREFGSRASGNVLAGDL